MSTIITCALSAIFLLQFVTCITLQRVTVIDSNNEKPVLRSRSIFEQFLKDMLNLLSTECDGRKLIKYCKVVSKEFDKMEYKVTHKLSRHFRELSKMYKEELQAVLKGYREEMDKQLPDRTAFFEGMNEVFTLQQYVKFRDYVYDVRDFCTEDKLDVITETRSVINIIIEAVKKLSMKDQNKLEKKMKQAIKEYEGEYLEPLFKNDSMSSLFFNLTYQA